MVEVELEDKITPLIEAPDDITISCTTDFDEDDLSQFGVVATSTTNQNPGDGIAFDNCNVSITEQVQIDIDCGVGEIRRTFTAEDDFGLKVSDIQIITITNFDPFNAGDIIYPSNVTQNGCMNLDTAVSYTHLTLPTILLV